MRRSLGAILEYLEKFNPACLCPVADHDESVPRDPSAIIVRLRLDVAMPNDCSEDDFGRGIAAGRECEDSFLTPSPVLHRATSAELHAEMSTHVLGASLK